MPSNEVLPILKEKVTEFKHGMPVITSLRNPSLKARHWQLIERLIQKSIARDKNFTLANLLEMNVSDNICEYWEDTHEWVLSLEVLLYLYILIFQIFKHKEKIQEISTKASNEATLEIMLEKVWFNETEIVSFYTS